jgi:hypothetical protein
MLISVQFFNIFILNGIPILGPPVPSHLRPHLHCRSSRAEPDRTELNRAERVTIHITSKADPNWKHCSRYFWTARMSNQVHIFSLIDNIWWRSLLFTRKRRFWVHTHFNPRKLDLLRNRIGRRLASKINEPGNTLGQARSGSVRRAVWMLPFHTLGLFSKLNQFGSARLAVWMRPS